MSLLVMLGEKLRVSYPIFLVLAGIAFSFIPDLPVIHIDPELIFLIFLPPLLYEAAWFTSWKEFWKWRRVIITLAFGLVILTSTVVAWSAYMIIPGFTLALDWLMDGGKPLTNEDCFYDIITDLIGVDCDWVDY